MAHAVGLGPTFYGFESHIQHFFNKKRRIYYYMLNEQIDVKYGYKCFLMEDGKLYSTNNTSGRKGIEKNQEIKLNELLPYEEKLEITRSGYHYALTYDSVLPYKHRFEKCLNEMPDNGKERKIVVCKIEIIGKSIYDGKIIDLVKHFDKIPKSHIRELSCHQYKIIEILPDKEKEIEELER